MKSSLWKLPLPMAPSDGGTGGGGGTAQAPAPAPALNTPPANQATDGLTSTALAIGGIAQTGASVADAVSAAIGNNQAAAPADQIGQALADLHNRLSAVETVVGMGAAAVAQVSPSQGETLLNRVAAVESAAEASMNFVQKAEPLFSKILNLFNVHWAGKL